MHSADDVDFMTLNVGGLVCVPGVPYCALECGVIVRYNKQAMCIVRVILRQLLALLCKLLSITSAADIDTHYSHHIYIEEGDVPITRADLRSYFPQYQR